MKFLSIVLAAILVDASVAFSPIAASTHHQQQQAQLSTRLFSTESTTQDALHLPAELRKITDAFANVPEDSVRHKQLLYMANQMPLLSPDQMIPENKVPGCLSTVFVDGTAAWSEEKQDYVIQFSGESDGLLTKGLVALLVRGLSGNTAEEIIAVDPQFIQEAQIGQSLTPGRNNGFLNMLAAMKNKAVEISNAAKASGTGDAATEEEEEVGGLDLTGDFPMYNGMLTALQVLKPVTLDLVDNSDQHAGHEGSKGFNGESHFDLYIVADAFDGLNLVKRHQLIYMLLRDIMPKIHALQISAKTPAEVE
eukprot:CAMPEP_0119019060 /NCGR_PEP_ID=MMETSP1176-20130426/20876_1 /TAXON_ID=265551 /ORGANISM="Synedropsis recta cf, Strain CCMP1620" /LENGTH=307 /DNA_ID=CAMNT_0006973185 /DNA_START=32 /DNA_END=955 /DNA_ORIENTATION=-